MTIPNTRLLVITLVTFISFALLTRGSFPQEVAPRNPVAGNWLGVLEVSGFKLRLVLKVTQAAEGKLTAKLDSLDQAANDLPIESISSADGVVRFNAPNLALSYEGKLSADGTEIAGNLKQGPATYPLTFKRTEKVPSLGRPQDPKKPYPYLEEEVSYENTIDKVKLAGHPYVTDVENAGACGGTNHRLRRAGSKRNDSGSSALPCPRRPSDAARNCGIASGRSGHRRVRTGLTDGYECELCRRCSGWSKFS